MSQVYQSLFKHPAIIQAMAMRFGTGWQYHARKIRDLKRLNSKDKDGLRVVNETLAAVSVLVDQIFTHDGERESRIRMFRMGDLFWVQHQNGNVIAYFDTLADAQRYVVHMYRSQIKEFNRLYRRYQKTHQRGLD